VLEECAGRLLECVVPPIPLVDLEAQHRGIQKELLKAIESVLQRQTFILGEEVARLEERIAAYTGSRYGGGVSSGTDALLVALMALGIREGAEVVTTPFSFFATAGVLVRLGARPVFVDIDRATYNLDPGRIERALSPRTKAIIAVHLYGQCADMAPILAVAERHGLAVVEDAAQAIGAQYRDGQSAGSMGSAGCLSFYPTKNLGALGDAGMVLTSRAELVERIRALRVHGGTGQYLHETVGGNFRLDAVQAAVLNVKLELLDGWTDARQRNAERYTRLMQARDLLGRGDVEVPVARWAAGGVRHPHVFHQFVVRVRDRDGLRAHLAERGVGTGVYYPVPLHLQPCFESLGYRAGDFPEAESAARETLALPIYPELTEAMQERVVGDIADFYAGAA
jgi:dTDP-4-amino-4,6-dideoxygalactose transaminase